MTGIIDNNLRLKSFYMTFDSSSISPEDIHLQNDSKPPNLFLQWNFNF